MNRKLQMREYYQKNKDKIRATAKKWKIDNREKVTKNNFEYKLKTLYKITPEHLKLMYKEQGDSCKICNTHKDDLKNGLFIDHCHKTLEVRGLLCQHCNSMLGFCKDDPERLEKAKQYLKTNGKFN